jgi:hypothetical protein
MENITSLIIVNLGSGNEVRVLWDASQMSVAPLSSSSVSNECGNVLLQTEKYLGLLEILLLVNKVVVTSSGFCLCRWQIWGLLNIS